MTAQLPSRERLAEIHKLAAKSDKYIYHLRADEVEAMTRFVLAAHEQEPVEYATHVVDDGVGEFSDRMNFSLPVGTKLYTHPAPVPAVPMAVAGFDAATAIRACMEEFPESMHDIVEECAQIAENTISTSHAAPVPAVPDEATPGNVAMMASTYAARGITYQWDADECNAAADSWNACRAAMLNRGKS